MNDERYHARTIGYGVMLMAVMLLLTMAKALFFLNLWVETRNVLDLEPEDIKTLKELKAEQCGNAKKCSVYIHFEPEE